MRGHPRCDERAILSRQLVGSDPSQAEPGQTGPGGRIIGSGIVGQLAVDPGGHALPGHLIHLAGERAERQAVQHVGRRVVRGPRRTLRLQEGEDDQVSGGGHGVPVTAGSVAMLITARDRHYFARQST